MRSLNGSEPAPGEEKEGVGQPVAFGEAGGWDQASSRSGNWFALEVVPGTEALSSAPGAFFSSEGCATACRSAESQLFDLASWASGAWELSPGSI